MEITASAYLVQGFYFQEHQSFGLGYLPEIGDAVVLNNDLYRSMFAGMIWREDGSDDWEGFLSDPAGESLLTSVRLQPNLLEFEKYYQHRDDCINYLFSIADGGSFWAGVYSGELVGKGSTTCILTPLDEDMLSPRM